MRTSFVFSVVWMLLSPQSHALLAGLQAGAPSTPDDATCLLQSPQSTRVAKRGANSPHSGSKWVVDQLLGVTAYCSSSSAINILQYVTVVSIAIQLMKMTRRKTKSTPCASYAASCKNILTQYGPEIFGLLVCLVLALMIQAQGSLATIDNALQEKAVTDLVQRWPTLLTADSLLGLQSMLRFVMLASSVARRGDGPTLLAQEVAAMLCAAALGHTILVARSPTYMLDGPLGGGLPATCDLLSVLLLAVLANRISKKSLLACAVAVVVAAYLGSQNRLSLAGDAVSDGLFTFVHTTELFAAFAYLSRALLSDVEAKFAGGQSVALGFAHVMMPIQQCLSAYYFVEITGLVENRVNIAAGYPSEILRIGGMTQLMIYSGVTMLHFAVYREPAATERYVFKESPTSSLMEPPHVRAE